MFYDIMFITLYTISLLYLINAVLCLYCMITYMALDCWKLIEGVYIIYVCVVWQSCLIYSCRIMLSNAWVLPYYQWLVVINLPGGVVGLQYVAVQQFVFMASSTATPLECVVAVNRKFTEQNSIYSNSWNLFRVYLPVINFRTICSHPY